MKKLREWINYNDFKWNDAGNHDLLPAGHIISKPDLLFEKLEDDVINRQIGKLLMTRKANEAANASIAPEKTSVSYDDFSKMDLRTATILEAEKVPKTTKLLKLKVDCGIDTRTIVSGIAEYFDPASLIGRQIIIIANLEPRKIKGIESKGMILTAEDIDGKLVLVSPADKTGGRAARARPRR